MICWFVGFFTEGEAEHQYPLKFSIRQSSDYFFFPFSTSLLGILVLQNKSSLTNISIILLNNTLKIPCVNSAK